MNLHDGSDSLTLLVSWRFPLYLYIEAMGYSNVPYLVADKPIKQAVVELGTIAFQISTIFSSFFREISRKGILISKLGKNPANH